MELFYPTLIEFTIQFLFFLDFEYEHLSSTKDSLNQVEQEESLFLKIAEDLEVAKSYKIRQQGKRVYCLTRDGKSKQMVMERIHNQKSIHITPRSILEQAKS